MNKIFGLFVILGVLGDLVFCKKINYPLPYTKQYEGKSIKYNPSSPIIVFNLKNVWSFFPIQFH